MWWKRRRNEGRISGSVRVEPTDGGRIAVTVGDCTAELEPLRAGRLRGAIQDAALALDDR